MPEVQEKKALEFKFEDGKLFIALDPNKDGEYLMKLEVNLAEVPDEVVSVFANRKK